MSSIYSAEVRKEAEAHGITDLQAYYRIQSRQKIMSEMSSRFVAQMELARQGVTVTMEAPALAPAPVRASLWNRIENYFANRFLYS